MLHITFRNPVLTEVQGCTTDTITITDDIFACTAPKEFCATLKNSMWWVKDDPFTSADVAGAVMVAFPPHPAAGPYFHVRIVSEFLYDGDTLLARKHHDGWHAADGQKCERIVLTFG
jgi:hypothetical protein